MARQPELRLWSPWILTKRGCTLLAVHRHFCLLAGAWMLSKSEAQRTFKINSKLQKSDCVWGKGKSPQMYCCWRAKAIFLPGKRVSHSLEKILNLILVMIFTNYLLGKEKDTVSTWPPVNCSTSLSQILVCRGGGKPGILKRRKERLEDEDALGTAACYPSLRSCK